MKLLNLNLKPRVPCIQTQQPEVVKVEAFGRWFAFDVNSLAVVQLRDEAEFQDVVANPPRGFKVNYQPNFPPSMPRAIGTMVFEATHKCNLRCAYCLTGDTKIPLVTGGEVAIKHLVGRKPFLVYSYDHEKRKVVPGRALASLTRREADLIEVELDNGNKVRCTPDHPWMLRDGSYKEASVLVPGDSLMPLYRRYDIKSLPGYEFIMSLSTSRRWIPTHRLFVGRKPEELWGRGGKKCVVHHRNFRKLDNRPENLEWVLEKEHTNFHREQMIADSRTPEGRERRRQTMQRQARDPDSLMRTRQRETAQGEEFRKKRSDHMKRMYQDPAFKAKMKQAQDAGWDKMTPEERRAIRSKPRGPYKLNPEAEQARRERMRQIGLRGKGGKQSKEWVAKRVASAKLTRELSRHLPNHKVVSVRPVQNREDVYDLTVEKHHNFAVSAGVFIHNCFVQNLYDDLDSDLTFETARRALDDFCVDGSIQSLGFFGGEPMMNWPLVLQIHAYASAKFRKRKPGWHMTTNGTLMSEKRTKWLAKNGFGFIVSLDGAPEHNILRATVDGRNSYSLVRRGLERMREEGLGSRITLRGTFTARVLDENNPMALVDRIEHLNQLCDQGFGNHVSVEPSDLSETACIGKVDEDRWETVGEDEMIRLFEPLYFNVAKWYCDRVRRGQIPRFHHTGKLLQRLVYALHGASECGAGHGYLSVAGGGKLYACHREQNSYLGNINEGGIDERLRAKWIDNRLYSRETCMTCPLRWWCGGGCREASVGAYEDITKPVTADCKFKWLWFKMHLWIMSELAPDMLRKACEAPPGQQSQQRQPQQRQQQLEQRTTLSSPQSRRPFRAPGGIPGCPACGDHCTLSGEERT